MPCFHQKVFMKYTLLINLRMMSKYYFITYINKRLGKQIFDSTVIDEHPFEWLKRSQSQSNSKKVIVNWKEISEEEFRAYNEVEYVDRLDQALTPQQNPFELISEDPSEGLRG
jgi:hypothetical protein